MNQLVSVIIPVYNVEKYIDECMQSVLHQEHQNFEVIMVDDGSTDSSGSICDKYVALDKRFQVFHTENKGIGAARNLAMENMKGEFCFFLDPDDVIETDTLSYLVNLIEDSKADVALAVTRQFRGDYTIADHSAPTEAVYEGHKDICEKVLFDKNDLKPLPRKTEESVVTYEFFSSLYRVDNLRNNNIHFLPISYGEDTYVCFKSQLTAKRVVTSTKIVYSHRRNPTSTTFQYHPFYLDETKEYYKYYLGLFEQYAPEYIQRASEALDGQYLRRCCAAIERELLMSPKEVTYNDKINTISHIRADEKFKKLLTWGNLKYVARGNMKPVMTSVKIGLYRTVIWVFDRRYRKRK